VICTAAAIVVAGVTTGVPALLVPAELHAAGASPGRIGLAFSVAGMLFAVGSILTASAGRRALRMAAICIGMLALAAALTPAVISTAPLALVAMLCGTTTARSVLWTVSYPLAAKGAEQTGAGLGVVVGLLNGTWAATAVLGPLGAGLGVEHLSPRVVFGVTEAVCIAVLAATVALIWRARQPAPRLWPHHRRATAASPAPIGAGGLLTAPRRALGRGPALGRHAPVPGGSARPRLPRPLTPRALAGPGDRGRHPYQRPDRRAGRRGPHRPPRGGLR
jgi:MFS family permease